MHDLLIILQIQETFNTDQLDALIKNLLSHNLNLVIVNNQKNEYQNLNCEIYEQEIGISKTELIKNIFNLKLTQNFKYILNWPQDLNFDFSIIKKIYHQIKRGFDIVVGYNPNTKIQFGLIYKFFYRLLTYSSKIKQPYSQLYCFNWFVLQNFIKNERILIEPAVYLFFQIKLHLKILSIPINNPIPNYVNHHWTLFSFKQTLKLIYYLFVSK